MIDTALLQDLCRQLASGPHRSSSMLTLRDLLRMYNAVVSLLLPVAFLCHSALHHIRKKTAVTVLPLPWDKPCFEMASYFKNTRQENSDMQ